MNRVEFMKQLEHLLADIPENDRLDAIAYYHNYFDEAGVENEAQVIHELGSPEKVAATIKSDLNRSEAESTDYAGYQYTSKELPAKVKQKRSIPIPIIIILLIFASPVLVGVAGGLFGGMVGVLGALFGVLVAILVCGIAFFIGGLALFVVGVVRVFFSPMEGLVTIGVGCMLVALGIPLLVLIGWIAFKWIPALIRGFVDLCQRIFHRGKRRNNA